MQHSTPCVYTQTRRTRPNDAPPHMQSQPTPSHYEHPPHPAAHTPRPNQPNPTTTTADELNKQHHHSLSTSSEEAEDDHQANNNDWEIIRRTKRKKTIQLTTSCPESHNRNIQPL